MPWFKACSSAHTIRKRYMWTQIFLNTEKKSPFSKIPGYVWMVKYDSKTLRVDADFFKYGEKISVFKNTRLRVDGQIRFKNATCGRRFSFKYGGKYLRLRKYPATCGRGLYVTLTNISSRETNYFNNFMQYLKPISSPFLSLWYVLSMFLSFGHFSASLSYKKSFL